MARLNPTACQKTSYRPNTYASNRGTLFLSGVRTKKCYRDRELCLHNNALVLAQWEAFFFSQGQFGLGKKCCKVTTGRKAG